MEGQADVYLDFSGVVGAVVLGSTPNLETSSKSAVLPASCRARKSHRYGSAELSRRAWCFNLTHACLLPVNPLPPVQLLKISLVAEHFTNGRREFPAATDSHWPMPRPAPQFFATSGPRMPAISR
jgi:hypothetical protein